MLLEYKVAVIYGAGGPIGGAVARAFAREGARVFLAGRTEARLDAVADAIRASGGATETAVVDALDQRSVDGFVDEVVEQAHELHAGVEVGVAGIEPEMPAAAVAMGREFTAVEIGNAHRQGGAERFQLGGFGEQGFAGHGSHHRSNLRRI